jgi:hypothetical protein
MQTTHDSTETTPKTYSWPIRVIALLLILQAIGLGYLGLNNLAQQFWPLAEGQLNLDRLATLSMAQTEALETAVLLSPPALLAVVAVSPFLFLRQMGWLMAMMVQALTLGAGLTLYFRDGPLLIYPVMIYGILMVLYLNSYGVRLVFHTPSRPVPPEEDSA